MTPLILLTLILGSATVQAAEVKVETRSQSTFESIQARENLSSNQEMTLFSGYSSRDNDCDENNNGGSNHWRCREEMTGKENALFGKNSECWGRSDGKTWACYEKIKETCEELGSNKTHIREFERFVGCVPSMSDCW